MKPRPAPSDFVRASGSKLTLGARPICLMGVNFPAYGWTRGGYTRRDILQARNFRAADYRRVAGLRMNVVRLNMSYLLFEQDEQPYRYDREGWDWLDKQVAWARAAGVYLMLDMHAPQGGYQAPGYDGDFWDNPEPRQRLKALWTAIARRYRHEPQMAAYSLLNEPCTDGRNDLWVAYARELAEAIRAVDENHLLNLEMDVEAGIPFALDLPNLMYDSHFYEPWRYAAQFWRFGFQGRYGDPRTPILPWEWREGANCGAVFKVMDGGVVGLMPVARTLETVREFEVLETEAGSTSRLMRIRLERESTPRPASLPLPVSASVCDDPLPVPPSWWEFRPPNYLHCARLAFPVRQGAIYQITGGLEFSTLHYAPGDSFAPFIRATLEARLLGEHSLGFYRERDLPFNVGEFGLSPHAFKAGRGGELWLKDALEIFADYNVNWQYWVYSGAADFALYDNRGEYPAQRHANRTALDVLQTHLKRQQQEVTGTA